jgi:tetrahydromethanopterin S-methyltransferase subunit G
MRFLAVLFAFLQGILDRLPTKREGIANEINDIKDRLHAMQQTKTKWTMADTAEYYKLTERLSNLEKRSVNANL